MRMIGHALFFIFCLIPDLFIFCMPYSFCMLALYSLINNHFCSTFYLTVFFLPRSLMILVFLSCIHTWGLLFVTLLAGLCQNLKDVCIKKNKCISAIGSQGIKKNVPVQNRNISLSSSASITLAQWWHLQGLLHNKHKEEDVIRSSITLPLTSSSIYSLYCYAVALKMWRCELHFYWKCIILMKVTFY